MGTKNPAWRGVSAILWISTTASQFWQVVIVSGSYCWNENFDIKRIYRDRFY